MAAFQGDLFLSGPDVYDISVGIGGEVDLRSAIQRAVDFAAWAEWRGKLGGGALIVGAGISGVVLASSCGALGRHATLTGARELFGRLTSPRWVDPRLYVEWPHGPTWVTGSSGVPSRWAPTSPTPTLDAVCEAAAWKGGKATEVVGLWQVNFEDVLEATERLDEYVYAPPPAEAQPAPSSAAGRVERDRGGWRLTGADGAVRGTFGVVIVCRGPHTERDALDTDPSGGHPHRSFHYWDPADPLWLDTPALPPEGEVVVVGAGDGGQQDLFRVLTGLDPVEALVRDLPHDGDLRAFAEAARAAIPAASSVRAPHRAALLANPGWMAPLRAWLGRRAPPRADVARRTVAYDGRPLNDIECFGLNQALTLALLDLAGRPDLLRGGSPRDAIRDATGGFHASARDCVGVPHRLIVDDRNDVRRFILRIGQKDEWWYGPPVHALRS